jgi:hypothetical protein
MRIRRVALIVGIVFAVALGAGVAVAAHPQVDPATVPTGFLTAHSLTNNVPAESIEKALRSGKTDVFIEHGRLAANGTNGFETNPGPVFVVVQKGSLTNEAGSKGKCTRKRYVLNQGFVPRGVHRFVAGPEGADYYAVYLLPRKTGAHRKPAGKPAGC